MDDTEAKARDIANLRIEVNTLADQIRGASLSETLLVVRRTVTIATVLVSASLLVSSVIHAWSTREVSELRGRVERLETRSR